ncbi:MULTISPECIES: DRTGG domain-containing protein [Anaerotruncus]|uniref:DRTGG domain-containing protein n=1 Tax=Anaerotruncus TaxID=244127 RepID=UPI00082CEBB6|nr:MULTISPECIES: DRTGG domain-containing protein [Anaerotruncus]RGX55620.1 hypothetical protein DWV16_07630 [Anaerotruncus sp. AF02-27]
MTVQQAAQKLGLSVLSGGEALGREIECVYCCDLLSFVMGRAPADSAWVTVMGNVNAMAVALLADVACVVLAEGAQFDDEAKQKAEQNDIAVLASPRPVYDTAREIDRELHP